MSSQRSLAIALLVVLATVAAVAPAGATTNQVPVDATNQDVATTTNQAGGSLSAQAVDADSVRMAAALQPDGDAAWTVTYRVRLDDDNETAAFDSLQADVESDPENYTERFAERMRSTAAAAEDATGREMNVRNVTVDARTQELGRTYGILEYTFEWTNFAAVDGDTITAGDALAGLFLDGQTTLVFSWPEGYGLVDAQPDTDPDVSDERSAGWRGPEDFGDGEPRIIVEQGAAGPGSEAGFPLAPLLAGALLGVVGLGAAVMWYRRRGEPVAPGPGDEGTSRGGGEDGAAAGNPPDEPPEELLSNEEKVLKLVRERGGRVKQQEIVEAFDWTEAKTSQVVRDLRDDGSGDEPQRHPRRGASARGGAGRGPRGRGGAVRRARGHVHGTGHRDAHGHAPG